MRLAQSRRWLSSSTRLRPRRQCVTASLNRGTGASQVHYTWPNQKAPIARGPPTSAARQTSASPQGAATLLGCRRLREKSVGTESAPMGG